MEKIAEEFFKKIQIKYSLKIEEENDEYFSMFIQTYLKGEPLEGPVDDYIQVINEDPNIIKQIAQDLAQFKAQYERSVAAQRKVEESTSAPIVEKEKEKEKVQPQSQAGKKRFEPADDKKQKLFDRFQDGQPKKKVKGENAYQKRKPSTDDKLNEQPGTEAKEGDQKKGLKHQLEAKGKQKCKFYPYCKNPQTCQFFHPSEKCTFFPNCRYGESCLYEHEACKFKDKCTKYNCPYSHGFKKNPNPIEEMMKSFLHSNNPLSKHKKKPQPRPQGKVEQPKQEEAHN